MARKYLDIYEPQTTTPFRLKTKFIIYLISVQKLVILSVERRNLFISFMNDFFAFSQLLTKFVNFFVFLGYETILVKEEKKHCSFSMSMFMISSSNNFSKWHSANICFYLVISRGAISTIISFSNHYFSKICFISKNTSSLVKGQS